MSQDRWTEVDEYIASVVVPPDEALDWVVETSNEAGLPAIQVSPPLGKLLEILARAIGARKILEIGTLGGYSAIWLARALPPGGRLITLESDPAHAAVARRNIGRAGLADAVEVRIGAALDTLSAIESAKEGPFDLVFIDADKVTYPDYFRWALRLSRRGSLIVADNVVREGAVIEGQSEDPAVNGVRRMNELIASEPRVTATAIQTVGTKGYDGFALALVTADP